MSRITFKDVLVEYFGRYVYPKALLGHFIIFTQLFFFLGVTILKSENENQILPN